MPRAKGNDLCEIYGYAPDDRSVAARKQWKSQECPFVGNACIKHNHPQGDEPATVFGSCSVVNKLRNRDEEEVIICPQRLYAQDYMVLKECARLAFSDELPVFLDRERKGIEKVSRAGKSFVVMIGQNSGGEISLSGEVSLSLDWVLVRVKGKEPIAAAPCEVQSIDITGNYHANWRSYAEESTHVSNSKHGMNWANVWKRLIPQILLKGAVASTSTLCTRGSYFILPDRVYAQFEKLVGKIESPGETVRKGVLNVVTYKLGPVGPPGTIREIIQSRAVRMKLTDFAEAFASGRQLLPLGNQLDDKVRERIARLLAF